MFRICCATLFALLLLANTSPATSFQSKDFDCPICGKKVQASVMMSYSRFGRSPSDLSDWFHHKSTLTCPFDGYTAFQYEWRELTKDAKDKTRPALEKPLIRLTQSERQLFAQLGHPPEDSDLRPLLWARTCAHHRGPDQRRDFDIAMLAFYRCDPEYQAHFRNEAIRALEQSQSEDWAPPLEKLAYEYLRAELLRQGGKHAEATRAFETLLAKRPPAKKVEEKQAEGDDPALEIAEEEEDDGSGIVEFAEEQLARIPLEKLTSKQLANHIIPTFPKLWAERAPTLLEKKHAIALEILKTRMKADEPEAADVMFDLIAMDKAKLVALYRSSGTDHETLGRHPELREWLFELRAKLPAKKDEESDEIEILRSLLGSTFYGDDWDLHQILMPHFRQWQKDKSLPPLPAGWDWEAGLDAYRDLAVDAFSELPHGQRLKAMEAFLQIMPTVPEPPDDWSVGLAQGLGAVAENREHFRGKLDALLARKWQGEFWQSVIAYINGADSESVRNSDLLRIEIDGAKVYEELLWDLFEEAHDPVWKSRAIAMLEQDTWLRDHVYSYLGEFPDEQLPKRLEKRIAKLRKDPESRDDWYPEYDLGDAEDLLRKLKLRSIAWEK